MTRILARDVPTPRPPSRYRASLNPMDRAAFDTMIKNCGAIGSRLRVSLPGAGGFVDGTFKVAGQSFRIQAFREPETETTHIFDCGTTGNGIVWSEVPQVVARAADKAWPAPTKLDLSSLTHLRMPGAAAVGRRFDLFVVDATGDPHVVELKVTASPPHYTLSAGS